MRVDGRRGTSVVELAICLPLLLLIVFGIIEFGFILYDKAMITNASREGARAGIVRNYPDRISDEYIIDVAESYCRRYLVNLGSRSIPKAQVSRTTCGLSECLTVTVTYTYTFLILPNLNDFYGVPLPGGITLTAQTVMRME